MILTVIAYIAIGIFLAGIMLYILNTKFITDDEDLCLIISFVMSSIWPLSFPILIIILIGTYLIKRVCFLTAFVCGFFGAFFNRSDKKIERPKTSLNDAVYLDPNIVKVNIVNGVGNQLSKSKQAERKNKL